MKWFIGVKTMEELKTTYRELTKKHHPDCGGNTVDMQEINNEYSDLVKRFANSETTTADDEHNATQDAETYRDIIIGNDRKKKKKQYSALQRGQLLAAYKNSKELKKQWCEEHGIAVSTLHKWLNCDKNQTGTQITLDWVPVTALPQTKNKTLLLQIGKFSITVEKSTDMELMSAVLSMLVALC